MGRIPFFGNISKDFTSIKHFFQITKSNSEWDKVKLTLAALAIIMPAGMITALMIWRPSILVNAAISGEMWYLSLVVLITIAVMIVLSGLGYGLYRIVKSPNETVKSICNEITKSPIDKSPIPGIWHAVTHIFVMMAETAKQRPLIMLGFAISYLLPAGILFAYYYGNPHFSAPTNWLLNHLLLPISHGLVLPGHAQWLAALCTGFLLAQAWYVISDLVVTAREGRIDKSLIISNLLKLFEKPITNLVGMTFLVSLVYILSGISFFSHLSGSWLMFNLLTIMFKVVLILYDTAKHKIDSTVAKSILFVLRFITYIYSVCKHPLINAEKLMFNIFAAIYAMVELVIYAAWQIMIRLPIAAVMQASSLLRGSEQNNSKENNDPYTATADNLEALKRAKSYLKTLPGANTSERMDSYLNSNIHNIDDIEEEKISYGSAQSNVQKEEINNSLEEFEAKSKIKLAKFKYQILESLKSTFFLFLAVYASIPVFSILITGHIPNSNAFQKFYSFIFDLNNYIDKHLANNLICKDILFQCVSILVCILAIAAIRYQSKKPDAGSNPSTTAESNPSNTADSKKWITAKAAFYALVFFIGVTVILQVFAFANEKYKDFFTKIVNKIWIMLAIAALASVILVQANKSCTEFQSAGEKFMGLLKQNGYERANTNTTHI